MSKRKNTKPGWSPGNVRVSNTTVVESNTNEKTRGVSQLHDVRKH